MPSTKNTPLRNKLAARIREVRAIQSNADPKYYPMRMHQPRVLATVRAESCLEDILLEACNSWLDKFGDQDSVSDTSLLGRLQKAMETGLSLQTITLTPRVAPVPWEDYTEDVYDLCDEVLADDETYAKYIEGIWEVHQQNKLRGDEEQQAFAQYLVLKARFGQ
jgi:hypothetical protein